MLKKIPAKKWLIIGMAASAVAAGSWGYFTYHNKKPATVPHSAGQTADNPMAGAMSMGADVVMMDARARQLAGVQTAPVTKRALTKEIRTTGKFALDENGQAYITSRVMGRIDEVYVNYEGAYVAPGDPLVALYSPDFISAQEEYLLALEGVERLRGASKDVVQVNRRLLEAARRKLELWGISAGDIEHLAHTRTASPRMIVRAPYGGNITEKLVLPGNYVMAGERLYTLADLSRVWLYLDIYEKDVASMRAGQEVVVTTSAWPGETFTGRISFINPLVDDATRTVKVRAEFANPDGKLKPNMFAYVTSRIPLEETLVVPASSLIDTGTRKVVYVAEGEDRFVKRDVVVGQEAEGYIQILSGLQPGDTVVTAAAFLIDSQTQLGSFGGHGGHGGHGGGAASGNDHAPVPHSGSVPSAPAMPVPVTPSPDQGGSNQHSGHGGH